MRNKKVQSRIQNDVGLQEEEFLFTQKSQLPNAGMGLYTAIDIYRDEIVAIFHGEVLTERQITLRVGKGKDRYFINLLDGKIVDSMNTTCFAKYANDVRGSSKTTFRNNVKINIDDKNNVCLSSIRNIKAGDELFCSYGSRYWKKHSMD